MLASLPSSDLSSLSEPQLQELVSLIEQLKFDTETNRLRDYVPNRKQREFHAAGLSIRERLLMAGNQLGKTLSAAMEVAMHMTGHYPDWWNGKRFDRPTRGIAGSESVELTKRGVQRLLLGNPETPEQWGSGAIPREYLVSTTPKPGVPNAVSAIIVRHISGGTSVMTTASYDQGRTKWQADTLDWIWFDEEPPEDVYFEGITRTNVTQGPVWITFTPLKGITKVVKRFYPSMTAMPNTHVTHMTIDDVDHLTAEQKASIIASYPPHEQKARAMGLPALGSGRVFMDVGWDDISVRAFPIPDHWVHIGALDFGWDHPSAAVRLSWDRDQDVIYVTHAFRKREATPLVFAGGIRSWGISSDGTQWLPWAWPHDGNQSGGKFGTQDQKQLAQLYRDQGLRLLPIHATFEDGTNGVEAGVAMMLERMQTGRWKVFSHLDEYREEFESYHRKDGLIVKEADDLLSASRYGAMMRRFAIPMAKPARHGPAPVIGMPHRNAGSGGGWMA